MGNIRVLDCTLRDGGYCNQWAFGLDNTKRIVNCLSEAGIEIIECGFLTEKTSLIGTTKFSSMEEMQEILPKNRAGKMFVCMINYGEYSIDNLPPRAPGFIDGIRVAFHQKDAKAAVEFCRQIQERGYKAFVQPMMTMNYSTEAFLELIQAVNEIMPYAFYIVDSFGVMKRKDLLKLFHTVEEKLSTDICMGYHSHNNMQLAYSNAQAFVDKDSIHERIIDSSVFGMGRGAGNLNTELFVEYLNDNFDAEYNLKPLLIIIDEILNDFYEKNHWGYSLPNYLSAKHKAHPNYASYLDAKKTLTVECMDEIFLMMTEDKKINFDKNYIEELYIKYMTRRETQESNLLDFAQRIYGNEVLIIAPGKSSLDEKEKIISCVKEKKLLTFSVNFEYSEIETDYIFLSNLRRFKELSSASYNRCIATSNIPMAEAYITVNYKELLNEHEFVRDNSGLMLISYLMLMGAKKIYLAGLDGYSIDPTQNFADQKMNFYAKMTHFEGMNAGLKKTLEEYAEKIEIEFLTTPKYVVLKGKK